MRHLKAAGRGDNQRSILEFLKRAGQATIPQLARALRLNIETVRGHLKALQRHELVRRYGHRKAPPAAPKGSTD